jgi:hypothetical protein
VARYALQSLGKQEKLPHSDGNNIGKFLDEGPDFTGLFHSGF